MFPVKPRHKPIECRKMNFTLVFCSTRLSGGGMWFQSVQIPLCEVTLPGVTAQKLREDQRPLQAIVHTRIRIARMQNPNGNPSSPSDLYDGNTKRRKAGPRHYRFVLPAYTQITVQWFEPTLRVRQRRKCFSQSHSQSWTKILISPGRA